MRLPRTVHFAEEARRFALRWCCEDCGFFDARAQTCRHFWPTTEHRRTNAAANTDETTDDETTDLVYCKEFEIA